MSLLEIKNLKKSFNDNVVLKDISLSVEKGEVLAIIGPSGSGKSTLTHAKHGGKYPNITVLHDDAFIINTTTGFL